MEYIKLTIELYKNGDTFGAWLSDNTGGSGIEIEGDTPQEVTEELASYIKDYYYQGEEEL